MIRVESRGRHPRAVLARQRCDIERVIEMTVREENSLDRERRPTSPAQGPSQRADAADNPRVDQVQPVHITQHMKANERGADLEHIFEHMSILTHRGAATTRAA
jgi:hypothetical protein